jgi:iron complex outermembrane receptor protein
MANAASAAETQTQSSDALEEIVVTAEKRESTLQKTPLSVSVITGADLAAKGISSIEDFTGVIPGLAVNNESGITKIEISILGLNA